MINIGEEIREKLSMCGKCVNCKLIVWDDSLEEANIKRVNEFKSTKGTKYFTVRCSWMKSQVLNPQQLTLCEGQQPYKP